MNVKLKIPLFYILIASTLFQNCVQKDTTTSSDQIVFEVKADDVIAEIQPTMYGIFFEDINLAADGGLYAELVKNRSFEFHTPLMGWMQPKTDRHSLNRNSGMAAVILSENEPNDHFARINVNSAEGYELINEGFRGMGIRENENYRVYFKARQQTGVTGINFELIDEQDNSIGSTRVALESKEWDDYQSTLKADQTAEKAKLKITFEGNGVVDLDLISLFPQDTWKGREKGLRKDLVQVLADLNPGFLRFPGGCIVEGRTLDRRYQWKKTVGDLEQRTTLINRWNTEFDHRPTPDYYQSFGIGFYEYFQLAEDLDAEPLPILGCGIACQFNTGELVPLDQLDPYVQDALDLIEFANGAVDTEWGALRASMGHPEPFNMKYIGIGNEQWGEVYIERLKIFIDEIKARYPDIIIVSGTGPFPDGEHFEYARQELKSLRTEIVDEHYYRNPQWFLDNADRYDNYDRNSYKIFAGEYAAQSVAIASPDNKNNWECALAEAAFMTGLERNADVVYLTSYAPLMAHADGWQWTPDLIWFNNLNVYKTPNYYVQQLFSVNKGTHLLNTEGSQSIKGENHLYASAVKDTINHEIIIKLVNVAGHKQNTSLEITGVALANEAGMIELSSDSMAAENSFENPVNIAPESNTFEVSGNTIPVILSPQSLSVIKVKYQ